MEYSIAFALVILLVGTSITEGNDGDGELEEKTSEELALPDILNFISRIYRFRKMIEDRMESGILSKTELRVPVKDALEKSTECFSQQLVNFNTTMMKVLLAVQKTITSRTTTESKSETETGVETTSASATVYYTDPVALVQQFFKPYVNYMKIWKDPQMLGALRDLLGKLRDAVVFSKDCLWKHLMVNVPKKLASLIGDLWEQSKEINRDPTAGVVS